MLIVCFWQKKEENFHLEQKKRQTIRPAAVR